MNNNITVDPEFQQLIVPLSQSEFELLRSQILAQGCLEPLYVWKTEDSGTAVRIHCCDPMPFRQLPETKVTTILDFCGADCSLVNCSGGTATRFRERGPALGPN